MKSAQFFLVAGWLAVVAGCGAKQQQKSAEPPLIKLVEVPAAPPAEAPATEGEVAVAGKETAGWKEEVKAGVGVGIRGRALDEHEGLVVTPVKALFTEKERIVFEIAIPYAMGIFQASEGRYPKSHEEFWEKIIVAGQIEPQMPELPEGHRYKYDPATHELMVERPQGWKFKKPE